MAATALPAEPCRGELGMEHAEETEAQDPAASIEEMTGLVPVMMSVPPHPAQYALWYVPEAVYGANPQGYFMMADQSYSPVGPPEAVTGPQLAGKAGCTNVQMWPKYTQLAVNWADSAVGCTVEEVLSELRALASSAGHEQPTMDIPTASVLFESWHQSKQQLSALNAANHQAVPQEPQEVVEVKKKTTERTQLEERSEKALKQLRADYEAEGGIWQPEDWDVTYFKAKSRDAYPRSTTRYKGEIFTSQSAALRAALADLQAKTKGGKCINIEVTVADDDQQVEDLAATAVDLTADDDAPAAGAADEDEEEEEEGTEDGDATAKGSKAKAKQPELPEPDGKQYARLGDGTAAKKGDATDYAKHALSMLQKEVEHQGVAWPAKDVVVHVLRNTGSARGPWRTWFTFEDEKYNSRNTAMKAIVKSQREKKARPAAAAVSGKRRQSAPAVTAGAATGSSSQTLSKSGQRRASAGAVPAKSTQGTAGKAGAVKAEEDKREGEGNTCPKIGMDVSAANGHNNEEDVGKAQKQGGDDSGPMEVDGVEEGITQQGQGTSKSVPAATTQASTRSTDHVASPLPTSPAPDQSNKHIEEAAAVDARSKGTTLPKTPLKEWEAEDAAVHSLQLLKAGLQQQDIPFVAAHWQLHSSHRGRGWQFSYIHRPSDDKCHWLTKAIRLAKEHHASKSDKGHETADTLMEDVRSNNKEVANLLDLKVEDVLPPGVKRGRAPTVKAVEGAQQEQLEPPSRSQGRSPRGQEQAARSAHTTRADTPPPRSMGGRRSKEGEDANEPVSKRARASTAAEPPISSTRHDMAEVTAPAGGAASSPGNRGTSKQQHSAGPAGMQQHLTTHSVPSTHAPEAAHQQGLQLQHSEAPPQANGNSRVTLPESPAAGHAVLPSGAMLVGNQGEHHHQVAYMAVGVPQQQPANILPGRNSTMHAGPAHQQPPYMVLMPQRPTTAPEAATGTNATAIPGRLTPLPQPKVQGDHSNREGQADVIPALVKLLKELGCQVAARQLMQRMKEYYSAHEQGKQDFVMHYMSLWTAVDLQDEDYVKEVLKEDWKLRL